VVDAEERPVRSFRIEARSAQGGARSEYGSGGSFTVRAFDAGEWELSVESDDHFAARQSVVVGPRTEPLRFVLTAPARVRGTVLDARGRPVADAEVRADSLRLGRSGADGRFEVVGGALRLSLDATCAGHAPSEPVEVALESGALVEGVVLRLRAACRLEGRVLDADGGPVARANVLVRHGVAYEYADVHTDARGEFALVDLLPGPADVTASEDDVESGSLARAAVTLVPPVTTLELRLARSDPVRIRGRVVQAGQPLECGLLFIAPSAFARARTGPDGRFDVTLAHPGEWKLGAWVGESGPDTPASVRFAEITVPDAESHALELDLDALRVLTSFDELSW
jgi:hypothetical protein